ncbi:M50 family metallopeptidase [Candidatus Micrarchaeota archaeon]|nr:M50 family metallopeptidase [Candidatus Micrarchaeota archaeon]MBU2476535.1 M50 family metallopeptidase [Candidatus Micrarchaeota archaeon]
MLEEFTSNIFFWILLFLIASLIFTWILKKFTSAKTYWIGSMYKTEKANPIFDKFAHHEKTINFLTELGLILGFGLIAVDFLYGKKMNKMKRFGLWIISILLLYFVFEFVFGIFSGSSFITEAYTNVFGLNLLSFVFALTGFAGFVIFSLAITAVDILTKTLSGIKACPGVAPVIPGVEIPNVPLVIPLHAWISLLLILIIHEGFHGITARKEKLKVKSSGLLLLGFLPIGAFVEPDEEEVKKAPALKQLKVYSAGPAANLASIIVFILLLSVFAVIVSPQAESIKRDHITGIKIIGAEKEITFCGEKFDAPAFGVLKKGMLLKEVNGVKIQLAADLEKAYAGKALDENFVFLVEDKGEEKTLSLKRNSQGQFGFTLQEIQGTEYSFSDSAFLFAYYFFFDFFKWLIILSLLIAVVNFLPIEPFDGGRIARVIFPSYFGFWKKEKQKKEDLIMKAMFYGVVFLFILNAIPLFF